MFTNSIHNKQILKDTNFSFFDSGGSYINCNKIFYAHYKKIPNIIKLNNLKQQELLKWLDNQSKYLITNKYHAQIIENKNKPEPINFIYFISDNIMLDIENGKCCILYQDVEKQIITNLQGDILKFYLEDKQVNKIYILSLVIDNIFPLELKVKKPTINFQLHYNEDFLPFHNKIFNTLKLKNKSGLYLLYGRPGTGKSTYIRYLVKSANKTAFFLTPNNIASLDAPSFTRFLLTCSDSIIVVEDAEKLLVNREEYSNSAIATLLNISDGLLGESLGIQIICTFNTALTQIDKALLRKGRLIASYDFDYLTNDKIEALCEKLRIETPNLNDKYTLADIYHLSEKNRYEDVKPERKQIGFR